MREILYRGKRKDNGEWVYGYYLPYHAVKDTNGKDVFAQIFVEPDEKHPKGWAIVTAETVGQYTGLKDKNGTKLFEGDILECQIWFECGCYPHSEISYREVTMPDIYMVNIDHNIEVVGNKFDNPELSKQKNSDRIYADFKEKAEG